MCLLYTLLLLMLLCSSHRSGFSRAVLPADYHHHHQNVEWDLTVSDTEIHDKNDHQLHTMLIISGNSGKMGKVRQNEELTFVKTFICCIYHKKQVCQKA